MADIDPTVDPKGAAAAVSEKPSDTEVNEFASKISAQLSKDMGEMFKEYVAQRTEHAQKAREGKPDEASAIDADNPFKAKHAREYMREMFGVASSARDEKDLSVGKAFSKALTYMTDGSDARKALEVAQADKAYGGLGGFENQVSKALGLDDFSAGGVLASTPVAAELAESLLSETAVMGDPGIVKVGVDTELEFPRVTTSPTAYWAAENAATNASTIGFSRTTLRPEQVTIIVPASNKMLRGTPAAIAAVEAELSRNLEDAIDAKLIRSIGVSNTPTGLRYLVASANLVNADTGTLTAATFEDDLFSMMRKVYAAKVRLRDPRWALSPRTRDYAYTARGTDNYLFRQDMMSGRLLGFKMAGQSLLGIQNIPENLSYTGSNESEIYFYETSHLRMGVGNDMSVRRVQDVAYNDASGSVVSAFSKDQTVFAIRMSVDLIDVNAGLSISVMPDCDYGA